MMPFLKRSSRISAFTWLLRSCSSFSVNSFLSSYISSFKLGIDFKSSSFSFVSSSNFSFFFLKIDFFNRWWLLPLWTKKNIKYECTKPETMLEFWKILANVGSTSSSISFFLQYKCFTFFELLADQLFEFITGKEISFKVNETCCTYRD